MAAAQEHRRYVGQILLDEGMLTPEDLERALDEHARTQRPLGEVLVDMGLVSPGAMANALAEQHGGMLRTEYGVSVGLHPGAARGAPEPQAAQAEGPDLSAWRAAVAERDALIVELRATVAARDAAIQRSALERARLRERLLEALATIPA